MHIALPYPIFMGPSCPFPYLLFPSCCFSTCVRVWVHCILGFFTVYLFLCFFFSLSLLFYITHIIGPNYGVWIEWPIISVCFVVIKNVIFHPLASISFTNWSCRYWSVVKGVFFYMPWIPCGDPCSLVNFTLYNHLLWDWCFLNFVFCLICSNGLWRGYLFLHILKFSSFLILCFLVAW